MPTPIPLRSLRVAVTVVTLTACAPHAARRAAPGGEDIVAAVRAAGDMWQSATERADAMGVLAVYRDAPETVIIRSDQSMVSYAELRRIVVPEFRGIRSQVLRPRLRHIYPLGPDAATESQVGSWSTTDTAGVTVRKEFALTRAWSRHNGQWQIVHAYLVVRPATPR